MSKTFLSDFTNPDGTVNLFHYAPPGTHEPFVLDPVHFGKNTWSASERKAEGTPKTFHYVDLGDTETFFRGKPRFHATIPAAHLYDATRDPDSHAERSRSVTDLIQRLKNAGYKGLFYSGVFPTVALWEKIAMTRHADDTPVKLARPVDKEYNAQLEAVRNDRDRGEHTGGLALADMMEERGRPGAHLLREGVAHGLPLRQVRYDPELPPTAALGHGTSVQVEHGEDGPLLYVQHTPDYTPAGSSLPILSYHVPVRSLNHFAELSVDWPQAQRSHTARDLFNVGLRREEPEKLARMKAPAGGAVDGQSLYQRGGQFMSAAFRRIRDVAARLVKLARPHDYEASVRAMADEPQVVADYLQDNDLPGAHIARQSTPEGNKYGGPPGATDNEHTAVKLYTIPGANDDGKPATHLYRTSKGRFYIHALHWPDTNIVDHRVVVRNVRHLAALLSDYPIDERAGMLRAAAKEGVPKGDKSEPVQLARLPSDWNASAAGMKHDPQIFADYLQENELPGAHIARAHTDAEPRGDVASYLPRKPIGAYDKFGGADSIGFHDGHGLAVRAAPQTGGGHNYYAEATYPLHTDKSVPGFSPTPRRSARIHSLRHFLELTKDFPKPLVAQYVKELHKRGMPLGEPVQLARSKRQTSMAGSAFHGSDPAQPLTIRELKETEDDHGLTEDQRLSPHVKPDKPGTDETTFTANKQHVAQFLDHLTNARLSGHKLRMALTDPKRTDKQKVAYAALHMSREAREFLDATQAGGAGTWYGEDVDTLEKALHHVFGAGFEPGSARSTLAKAVIAATSSGQNPRNNALTAYHMIREGMKRNPKQPFLNMPAYNEPAFRAWVARAGKLPDPGHTDVDKNTPPVAEHTWYMKHVYDKRDTLDGQNHAATRAGYQNREATIIDKPGDDDHGKLVRYKANGKWYTPEGAGAVWQRQAGRGTARNVRLPITDHTGRLKPKGWNAQGEQVESGVERLQKLISTFGEEGTRQWLLTTHPDSTFDRLFNYKPDRSQIGTNENLPGMFIFGPKFGAFGLNLHGNTPEGEHHARWLTADKWWSRTWNRFMGTLLAGAKKGGHVESPRGTAERKMMVTAARDAYKKAGLNNVAQLQAVMWYYEQALWRMLGVKQAKSYSFKDGAKAILAAHARHEAKQIDFPHGYNLHARSTPGS